MNLVLFGLFVLFLVAIQFASAKTVDEIVEKYIRVIGGSSKLGAIKSIYSEGLITIMDSTLIIKIYQSKENSGAEKYTIQWQLSDLSENQYQTLQSPESIQLMDKNIIECLAESAITAHLINYIADGNKVALIGKDVVEEIVCYKITVTTPVDLEINYWFNKSDGLLHQTAIKTYGTNASKAYNMRTKYADYRAVQGVLFAHKIEIVFAGSASIIYVNFNKIILNEPLNENFVNTYY